MKKILILLLKLIGALFIVGAIAVFAIIIKYRLELPNLQSMVEDYKPQMATIIYDKNNKAHHIDYLGREIMQSKSGELKYLPVKTDIINGKKYIEFEGKKYHADVY